MSKTHRMLVVFSTLFIFACGAVPDDNNMSGEDKDLDSSLLATSTFTPVFDTYVDQSNATTSYASSTVLSADGPSGSNEKHAYLEFNVTGITGTIASATLRITVGSGSAASSDQYVIKKIGTAGAATRQLTGTYTWNAKPTVSSTVIANKTGFTASTTSDFTIPASAITGNGYYAFAMMNNSGSDGMDFSSMEGAVKPQLIINTSSTGGGTCTNMYSAGSKITPKNMWVWNDSIDTVNSSTERTNLLNFAESRNITTLYVNAKSFLENYSSSSTTRTNFITLINAAAAKCINVQLLVGNGGSYVSDSEKAANYPKMTLIANNAKAFVNSLSGSNVKPTAIHWDLEPHQLDEFDGNEKEYVQRLVNGFQKVRGILAGTGLKQAEDIPHWFDSATYNSVKCDPNDNRTTPQYSLVGYQCLIKVLDQVDIMDYRDTSALTIAQATDEMNYANANNNFNGTKTAVVIGQETGPLTSSTLNLTFYDELRGSSGNRCSGGFTGLKCMEFQMQTIQHTYNSALGYPGRLLESAYSSSNPSNSFYLRPTMGVPAGITVHHYEKYNSSSIIANFP
jgi:hypothetical protein